MNRLVKSIMNVREQTGRGIYFANRETRQFVSYAEMYKQACVEAAGLQKLIKSREYALIVQDNPQDMVRSIWACLLSGIVAIPVSVGASESYRELETYWSFLHQPHIITNEINGGMIKKASPILSDAAHLIYSAELPDQEPCKIIDDIGDDDTIIILFSSGTTGIPKGIQLSANNIECDAKFLNTHYAIESEDIYLNWLPLTHVLGLCVFHLAPLLMGADQVLIATNDFLHDPNIWMILIAELKVTVTVAANFGFNVFISRCDAERLKEIDLSALRIVINSAEPISSVTLQKFTECLQEYGFQRSSVKNLLGMTEVQGISSTTLAGEISTVCVQAGSLSIGDTVIYDDTSDQQMTFVSAGMPFSTIQVRVCDDDDHILADDMVGHIQVFGPSVTSGYYGLDNSEFFTDDHWFRTGDTGFFRKQYGDLVVVGRQKDIVIINGRNFYCNDIDRILLQATNIPIGEIAVCSLFEDSLGKECLIVFIAAKCIESANHFQLLRDQIQKAISSKLGVSVTDIVAVEDVLKTRSGKIRRAILRDNYRKEHDQSLLSADNHLDVSAASTLESASLVVKTIHSICCDVLRTDHIELDMDLFLLGLDSISMVQIIARINEIYGHTIAIMDFTEYSTIKDISAFIEDASQTVMGIDYPTIEPGQNDAIRLFPTTPVQAAYVLGRSQAFEMGGNGTHAYMEIETSWDIGLINHCLNKIISSIPAMRTIFTGDGFQEILPVVPEYKISGKDLTQQSAMAQADEIATIRQEMSHQIFEVTKWPLFEFRALQLAQNSAYLFVSFDLLLADAASFMQLGSLLADLYKNPEDQINVPKINARDYILASQELRQLPIYEADKQFWLNKLNTFPEAPNLPYKVEPRSILKPYYKRKKFDLPADQWSVIKKKARQRKVTPSVMLCCVLGEVLSLWSNQEHLAINLTSFNRHPFHQDVTTLFGDFTTIVPLDVVVDPALQYWEKVDQIQQTLYLALEHRHYDGIEFIQELSKHNNFEFGKAVLPIVFSSMLFDGGRFGWSELGSIRTMISQTPQVFLDCQVIEDNGAFTASWDYVEELFEESVIDQMFSQFTQAIEVLAAGSDPKFSCSEQDLAALAKYNQTEQHFTAKTLIDLLVPSFELNRDNIAVEFGDQQITYRQLDIMSNQVANYLTESKGVKLGDCIGVLAKRKINTIVNIVGIIKSGASYVPIEPHYPAERQRYMLENSQCNLLLEPETYVEYGLDRLSSVLSRRVELTSTDTAYVIYTSGSTGKPKGVEIAHGAVTNTVEDINTRFSVSSADRIIGLSSMCFDLSVYDIFGSLSSGACLVLIDDQHNVPEIDQVMKAKGITIWNSVPAIMDMYLDNTTQDNIEHYWQLDELEEVDNLGWESQLRLVLLSGDWIPMALPGKIVETFDEAQVISLGGATEASIWSIFYPITSVNPAWKSIPYGMPLANQQIYILDFAARLCPVGVKGEIFIGGLGVAKGYKNDSEKTLAAFIDHELYGRIYRTGDQGVLCKEGYVEFLGRNDDQIKIRGYRIELGEITNRLTEYTGVKKAAVIDWAYHNGKRYLCAYIVSKQNLNVADLRLFLAETLPEYMIPAYFIQVNEIPLSGNGKVNRRALPEPEIGEIDNNFIYVAPINDVEEKLAQIWSGLLQIEKVGTQSNFFEMGGSSITLVNMHTKIEKIYPDKIKPMDIFQHATIAQLAELIIEHNQVVPKVNGIVVPNKFLQPDGTYSETTTIYQFVLAGDDYEQLIRQSKTNKIQPSAKFLAAYLYMLSHQLETDQMNAFLMAAKGFCQVLISLEQYQDYQIYEQDVAAMMALSDSVFTEQELKHSIEMANWNVVVPILYDMSTQDNNQITNNGLTLGYIINETAKQVEFELQVSGKIRSEAGEAMAELYSKILIVGLQTRVG